MKKARIHLVCNAHLDPVWLWEWPEGAAEAVSTFRTAVELCEQSDTFVFNHNEAILYKWVQEYAPDLFKRIKRQVRAGRWHIMGGWYLQPACNMPSGESFVRQILMGKSYFKEQFGKEPTTAINFDPFGHTRGLVQILAKSGYDSYLFLRPRKRLLELKEDPFVWVGYDGSEVMATRLRVSYSSALGKAREKIEQWMRDYPDDPSIIPWGVGNHGGGPSRIDLRNVDKLIGRAGEAHIRHSTPEAYFRDLRRKRDELPRRRRDLNPTCVGCYTSMIRLKQKHRLLENQLYALEKMASAASSQGLMKYPKEQIDEALCDLLTCEFHDALPGSSIEPVEKSTIELIDHGLEIVSRAKTRTFFALTCGQHKAKPGEIPILVYNHHPFKVSASVECEFNLPDQNISGTFTQVEVYKNGKRIASQLERELSDIPVDWRKRVVFAAELEASRMNRFDCRLKAVDRKPVPVLQAKKGKIVFKNSRLEVVINTKTGLVDKYRVNGRDCVGSGAFEPIVMSDSADPWGMIVTSFRRLAGRFRLMSRKAGAEISGLVGKSINSVRVIEDGPVRSVVEAVFSYGRSFICQRYKLPKKGTEIEVEVRVYWNEKDKMLKLLIPVKGRDLAYYGQVAYGTEQFAVNGQEVLSQKWAAVVSRKRNVAVTCINDGTYGSDCSRDGLALTLLRSPAYSAHSDPENNLPPAIAEDRFTPRIDQGERLFHFWFNGGNIKNRLDCIDREALTKNERLFALPFFPTGSGTKPKPLAVLSDKVVQITAIKRSEKGNDLIVRLFEPTGRRRATVLSIPLAGLRIKVDLNPFEIKTLAVNLNTGKWRCVDLMEKPLQQ